MTENSSTYGELIKGVGVSFKKKKGRKKKKQGEGKKWRNKVYYDIYA